MREVDDRDDGGHRVHHEQDDAQGHDGRRLGHHRDRRRPRRTSRSGRRTGSSCGRTPGCAAAGAPSRARPGSGAAWPSTSRPPGPTGTRPSTTGRPRVNRALSMNAPKTTSAMITASRSSGGLPNRSLSRPSTPLSVGAPVSSCMSGTTATTPMISSPAATTEPTTHSARRRRVSGENSTEIPAGIPNTCVLPVRIRGSFPGRPVYVRCDTRDAHSATSASVSAPTLGRWLIHRSGSSTPGMGG